MNSEIFISSHNDNKMTAEDVAHLFGKSTDNCKEDNSSTPGTGLVLSNRNMM